MAIRNDGHQNRAIGLAYASSEHLTQRLSYGRTAAASVVDAVPRQGTFRAFLVRKPWPSHVQARCVATLSRIRSHLHSASTIRLDPPPCAWPSTVLCAPIPNESQRAAMAALATAGAELCAACDELSDSCMMRQ